MPESFVVPMPLLHPLFYIILGLLILGAVWEFSKEKGYQVAPLYYVASALLLFVVGFRNQVGADYPAYNNMYSMLSIYYSFEDVWAKATFGTSQMEIEWLYSLMNMVFFQAGLPFFIFTFFLAALSLVLKSRLFFKFSPYPTLSLLLLYMPYFLISESGQMRQGLGAGIAVIAFLFAVERRLFLYLVFMYLAIGVHKTNAVFLPAYWLIQLPLNRWKIILLIGGSVLLSPFKIYEIVGSGFIESITPQDIYAGYTGYINDEELGAEMGYQKTDVLYFAVIFLMILYDKTCCETVAYYEYFRNLSVFGFCFFFLVKGNTIFATRGVSIFVFFSMCMVLPCIAYAVKQKLNNSLVFALCIAYSIYITYSFTINQGVRAKFLLDEYNNFFIN